MKSILIILLVTSALFCRTIPKEARVLIYDLEVSGAPANYGALVSSILRTKLIKYNAFTVIDRASLDKILVEQQLQQSGCTADTCLVTVGKLLNADIIMTGNIMQVESVYHINVTFTQLESAKIIWSEHFEIKDSSLLDSAIDSYVAEIAVKGKNYTEVDEEYRKVTDEKGARTAGRKFDIRTHTGIIKSFDLGIFGGFPYIAGIDFRRKRFYSAATFSIGGTIAYGEIDWGIGVGAALVMNKRAGFFILGQFSRFYKKYSTIEFDQFVERIYIANSLGLGSCIQVYLPHNWYFLFYLPVFGTTVTTVISYGYNEINFFKFYYSSILAFPLVSLGYKF